MAETEQAFGHEITRAALNAETLEHKRGQRYALFVSIAAFLCSFGLGVIGAHMAAAVARRALEAIVATIARKVHAAHGLSERGIDCLSGVFGYGDGVWGACCRSLPPYPLNH